MGWNIIVEAGGSCLTPVVLDHLSEIDQESQTTFYVQLSCHHYDHVRHRLQHHPHDHLHDLTFDWVFSAVVHLPQQPLTKDAHAEQLDYDNIVIIMITIDSDADGNK